jgi:hypothetical protein
MSPVTDLVTDLVTAHTPPDMTKARKQCLRAFDLR